MSLPPTASSQEERHRSSSFVRPIRSHGRQLISSPLRRDQLLARCGRKQDALFRLEGRQGSGDRKGGRAQMVDSDSFLFSFYLLTSFHLEVCNMVSLNILYCLCGEANVEASSIICAAGKGTHEINKTNLSCGQCLCLILLPYFFRGGGGLCIAHLDLCFILCNFILFV